MRVCLCDNLSPSVVSRYKFINPLAGHTHIGCARLFIYLYLGRVSNSPFQNPTYITLSGAHASRRASPSMRRKKSRRTGFFFTIRLYDLQLCQMDQSWSSLASEMGRYIMYLRFF